MRVKTTIVGTGEEAAWASGVTFLGGFWLVLSAFMFVPLDVREAGAWNSLAVGIVLALAVALRSRIGLDLAGLAWLNAALGAWLMASPVLFGYATNRAQTWNSLLVGFVLVMLTAAAASTRGVARSESRTVDEEIRDAVCRRMAEHPDLVDAADLEVAVHDGEVTLHGSVANRAVKRLAEDLAASVPGVIDVHNALRVEPRAAREITPAA